MATYQVSDKFVELLKHFEGAPRMTPRLCEGDRWELGYGCTYDFNNVPFGPDSTIDPDDVMPLAMHCASREAQPLWDHLERNDVELNQGEVDALAFWAFNIGANAAIGSNDVTGNLIAGRREDAAAGFAGWTGATSAGPSKRERNSGRYKDMIAWSKKRRRWVWVGQDGRACNYFRRMRGLLRRQLATGCVFLGYEFMEACHNDAVSMRTQRRWDANKRRWQDGIVSQTSFAEVERVARRHPIEAYRDQPEHGRYREFFEDDDDDEVFEAPKVRTHRDNRRSRPTLEVTPKPIVVAPPPAPDEPYAEDFEDWEGVELDDAVRTPPIVPDPNKKPIVTEDLGYEIDESLPPKSLENSERVDGYVLQAVGRGIMRLGTRGVFGAGAVSVFQYIESDPALFYALMTMISSIGVIAIGYLTGVAGNWKRANGEATAVQPLG